MSAQLKGDELPQATQVALAMGRGDSAHSNQWRGENGMGLSTSQQILMGAIYNGADTHDDLTKGLNREQQRQVDRILAYLVGRGLLKLGGVKVPIFSLSKKGFYMLTAATAPFSA